MSERLDDADIGEMLLGAKASVSAGFTRVSIDPSHLLLLLQEIYDRRSAAWEEDTQS